MRTCFVSVRPRAAGREGRGPDGEGEPESDLWQAVVVACDGPFIMEPGYKAEFEGPTFVAATRSGVPLGPGEYVATVKWPSGLFQPLTYPVTVTETKRPYLPVRLGLCG